MICRDEEVKWWRIISPTKHKLIQKSKCVEPIENLYAEYSDGTQELIHGELLTSTLWHWENLPSSEIESVTILVTQRNELELVKIANTYMLADYIICCDTSYVIEQFKQALKHNLIG